MGLPALLKKLGADNGIDIDDDELEAFGLSADEGGAANDAPVDDVLSEELPGEAAGQIEIFLAADSTTVKEPTSQDGDLLWYPIIREGQWAMRPGTTGKKRRTPLKVIAGKSKDQRREIGLKDIVDAFDDTAVQHVTVPTSHNNSLLENTGFIDKLKIVQGKVKDQTKKGKPEVEVAVLMGGYRFTEPDVKDKVTRGTIANRSAGLLYDYVDTERGKTWPVVLEHVALTNKPWITGMANFGRKLRGVEKGKLEIVGLSLSDEGPDEREYTLALADDANLSVDEGDFLAQESQDWSKEGSPNWLKGQVNALLNDARAKKIQAKRAAKGNTGLDYDLDYPPNYRCCEAKPGTALISDGYSYGDGDGTPNYWAAPIEVKDGAVEIADYSKWSALKQAYIPDDRPDPAPDKMPLAEQHHTPPKSRLELAQQDRKARFAGLDTTTNPPREVVKQDMSDTAQLSDLSPEARKLIEDANARAEAAEARAEGFEQKIERLTGAVQSDQVSKYIGHLKDALGLSEDKGFGGVLTVVRELMLADDGEPAVQSDVFSDDSNAKGELSLSEGIKRIFGAFEKAQEGKAKLGEHLSEPADASKSDGEELDADGKPVEKVDNGKPGAGEKDGEELSTQERVATIIKEAPAMASLIGGVPAVKGAEG